MNDFFHRGMFLFIFFAPKRHPSSLLPSLPLPLPPPFASASSYASATGPAFFNPSNLFFFIVRRLCLIHASELPRFAALFRLLDRLPSSHSITLKTNFVSIRCLQSVSIKTFFIITMLQDVITFDLSCIASPFGLNDHHVLLI